MNSFKIIVIFLCVITAGCSSTPKVKKQDNVFNFSKGSVSLKVDVLLPDSYEKSVNKTYPALYLLDGYWNKNPIKDAYNGLRFDNMVPEMIIVSISYPEDIKDVKKQRMWDLTPIYDSGFKAGGNASELLDLIVNEVTPHIEDQYSIDNERTILTGHSLAGLFTLYAMYQNPETFTHYAAISPSALWANETLSNIDQKYSDQTRTLQANLYITYGTEEYTPYVSSLKRYINQLESKDYEGLDLSLAKVEGLRHVGMASEGFLRGIVWALSDIRPKGPSEFEKINLEAIK